MVECRTGVEKGGGVMVEAGALELEQDWWLGG